jgi:hypothetical protein
MALDSLTIVITAPRVIDGLVFASNTASMSPEDYCTFLLSQDGHRFADANSYGVITSAAFVARFTPQEYGNILAAAQDTVPVPDPIPGVPTADEQQAYDDMVAAYALIEEPTAEETAMYQAVVDTYLAAIATTNQAEIDAAEAHNDQAAQVQALLDELFASPLVALDDPRAIAGLELLVNLGLLDASRPGEILFYARPIPGGAQ